MSREMWIPSGAIFDHRVENRQQLAHTRGERDLLGFASLEQALVKRANHWIIARRTHRGHVERAAHCRPPAGDMPFAPARAAVAIKGGQADQGRDLFTVELPQFGQVNDQGARRDGAHPAHAAQLLFAGTPGGVSRQAPHKDSM